MVIFQELNLPQKQMTPLKPLVCKLEHGYESIFVICVSMIGMDEDGGQELDATIHGWSVALLGHILIEDKLELVLGFT